MNDSGNGSRKADAAVRKLIFRLAGFKPDEPHPDEYSLFDAVEDATRRLDEIENRLEDTETAAQSALGVAQAKGRADGGESKTEYAARQTRNELVKRAALNGGDQRLIVSDVQMLCSPRVDVKYQTVKDAWGKLIERWGCFERTTNAEGTNALLIRRQSISPNLAHAVNEDLDRDDLAKRLMSTQSSRQAK